MRESKKAVWGWALYDWANSAYVCTVMAVFFPIFFKSFWSAGADVNMSTARLGLGNSLASLVVALMAPILGAIADKGSAKKKFLIFFAYLGVLATACLFLVEKGEWALAILAYTAGVIGFSGANIFYDALLPSVAGEEKIDSVSCLGYSLGYLGGGLLLAVNVFMTMKPGLFGLADAGQAVRWSFLSVAVWWGLFSLFTIAWVPEVRTKAAAKAGENLVAAGFRQFISTFRKIRHLKMVFLFLIAYWLYIDGVDTIIRMAVDYGMSIGFKSNDLVLALLITQFVGFPSALIFGRLGSWWGVRKSIFLAIGIYIGVSFWGVMISNQTEFYVLAVVVGLVQGGVQALSRSYYSRLIPLDQAGEFYGFFNMMGKFAAIFGPTLMAVSGLLARRILMPPSPTPEMIESVGRLASRWSIGSVALLFVAGALVLFFVDEDKGRREARELNLE